MALEGSETHKNLQTALAFQSEYNLRYSWFAERADVGGFPDLGGVLRSLAQADAGHAHTALDYLDESNERDSSADEIRADLEASTARAVALGVDYSSFSAVARSEGFDEIADYFDELAEATQRSADRLSSQMDGLE